MRHPLTIVATILIVTWLLPELSVKMAIGSEVIKRTESVDMETSRRETAPDDAMVLDLEAVVGCQNVIRIWEG